MKSIQSQYASLEKKWMNRISAFVANCFKHTFLPSHDFTHHQRTWLFAKQIIDALDAKYQKVGPELIEKTFWSAMFHDIGLSKTVSAKHGTESVKLFRQFVRQNPVKLKAMDEVLHAIEHHDNKHYTLTEEDIHNPYHILTMADDLDAFGHIGIYRNIEVFLLRDIQPEEIPTPVLEGLQSRYTHFSYRCKHLTDLYSLHTDRFMQTNNYFKNLEQELHSIGYKSYYFIGHMGILNYIQELVSNKANIYRVNENSVDLVHDNILSDFFKHFLSEVNSYSS